MIEENARKDIVQIIKLSQKYDHKNINYAKKLLQFRDRTDVLQSIFGKRYFKRLEDIVSENVTDQKCVICCKNEAADGVVCPACIEKLIPFAGATKRVEAEEGAGAEVETGQEANTGNDVIKNTLQFADDKVHKFAEKVNVLAGGEGKVDLHMRDLFKDVFKKHSSEEADCIFICGTAMTTPSASQISKEWPKPWLYSRVLLYSFVAFYMLLLCWTGFQNPNVLPGIMMIGSFMMPIAVLLFFFEMNAPRNVSIFTTVKVFFLGGCASLLMTLILFEIYPVGKLDFMGAIMVGVIEEFGKLLIVAGFIKRLKNCQYILNGLLIGGAVGAGFAAFESAGYAFRNFVGSMTFGGMEAAYNKMIDVIYMRAMLAPGGHVAWAAISGAAIMIALKGREFHWNVLKDHKFLALFILSVVMHAIWDMPIGLGLFVPVVLVAAAWIVLLVLIHNGLNEINKNAEKTSVILNGSV